MGLVAEWGSRALPLHCSRSHAQPMSWKNNHVLCDFSSNAPKSPGVQGRVGGYHVVVHGLHKWNCIRNTTGKIHQNACGPARSLLGEHTLNRYVRCQITADVEHNLHHLLMVGLWVEYNLGQRQWVLFWCTTGFVAFSVVPNFFMTSSGWMIMIAP